MLPQDPEQAPATSSPLKAKANLTPEQLSRMGEAYAHAQAAGTARVYLSHWVNFKAWCEANGHCHLPAGYEVVAAYMTERALVVSVASLRIAQAAIRSYHEDANLPSPTTHPYFQKVMKGLAKIHGRAAKQVTGIDQDAFNTIIEHAFTPRTSESGTATETQQEADRRATLDIALISFMRDAMLRRSEAANAEWQHVGVAPDGAFVLEIPTAKTDHFGDGASQFLSFFTVQALANMLQLRGGDPPEPGDKIFGIGERQIANHIKAAAQHAGLAGRFSGHSPRVGMAIDLGVAETELPALAQAGRWDSAKNALAYIRGIPASNNAVANWYERNDTQDTTR